MQAATPSEASNPTTARPSLIVRYQHFGANVLLLWLAVLFYRTNHYYLQFLSDQTQGLLLWLALACTGLGLVWHTIRGDSAQSRGFVALTTLWRRLTELRIYLREFPRNPTFRLTPVSKVEQTTILFLLIKFIYLPMMIEFIVANWAGLQSKLWLFQGTTALFNLRYFNLVLFPLFIDVLFLAECGLYAFGYAFEFRRLNNEVRSVEPTVLGWVVALCCYPPFNGFVNAYVLWYTGDAPSFSSEWATFAVRVAVLACFAIYFWGALSLGTRCSNLTNRGIVTGGAFALVRHPAYTAKNLAWWLGLLPALTTRDAFLPAVLSMAFWSFIYFLRAITEERHLIADPAYQEYCRKVKYRFIPGLF